MQKKNIKLVRNRTLKRFLEALKSAGIWLEIDGFDRDAGYIAERVEYPEMAVDPGPLCLTMEDGGIRFCMDRNGEGSGKKYITAKEAYRLMRMQKKEVRTNETREKKGTIKRGHLTLVK